MESAVRMLEVRLWKIMAANLTNRSSQLEKICCLYVDL